MYELEKSKNNDYTIKVNGKYIHSRYNPQKEAEQFIKSNVDLFKKDKVLIYGIGLGYHIVEALRKDNIKIYIFEWDERIIECCKKVNREIFEDNRVTVISKNNKNFYKLLGQLLDETKDILIHKPSLDIIKGENEELYNLLNDFSIRKQLKSINKKTLYKYDENFRKNKRIIYAPLNEFIQNMKNRCKTIIITAAGPSLDSKLKYLKKNRQEVIIFTVGSALRTVIENDIYPDAIFVIDGSSQIKNQFVGFENLNIPLCFSAYASSEALEIYSGPKYIFNDNDEDNSFQITTGGSVAIAALDIATKCNPERIVFLGQDLALLEGKNHVESYEKMHKDRQQQEYKLIEAPGVSGNTVKTIQSYILFRNSIERIIKLNQNIKFINCSDGILIRGTVNMDLESFLDKEINEG